MLGPSKELYNSWRIGKLNNLQMKPGVFREEYIAIIVRELLKGLEYLHTEGKLHRDIKGELFHGQFDKLFKFCLLQPQTSCFQPAVK